MEFTQIYDNFGYNQTRPKNRKIVEVKSQCKIIPNEFIKICVGLPDKNRIRGVFFGFSSTERIEDISARKVKWKIMFDCMSIN